MAAASSTNVSDITQCSICLETFKEPKALPCIHTFCRQCLDKHCEGQGQRVPCPLCRKVFTIPRGGNNNLPNNFSILQLLLLKQSTESADNEAVKKQRKCKLCLCSGVERASTSYCIECDQHICDQCSVTHRKENISRSHRVVCKEEQAKVTLSYCDEHPGEQNRLYCYDCKMVTCPVCIVSKHKMHFLTDVHESAEKFLDQMKVDVEQVSACALRKLENIRKHQIASSDFLEKVTTNEREICEKYDNLMFLIQKHKSVLMQELNAFKGKILKELETEKDEIERQFVIMHSFETSCLELIDKGRACDISRQAPDLHARADELMKTQKESDCDKLNEVESVEISFRQSAVENVPFDNIIYGELRFRDKNDSTGTDFRNSYDPLRFQQSPVILHIMPCTCRDVSSSQALPITGITVLGREVFIVRGTPQVDVYDVNYTFKRCIYVDGAKVLQGIASSYRDNCLYVGDPEQMTIYRYDLTKKCTTCSWEINTMSSWWATYWNSIISRITPALVPRYGLCQMWTLHLDPLTHRLYIGELAGGRVIVLDVDIDGN